MANLNHRLESNIQLYKNTLERIFEKYSNLDDEYEGLEVDLAAASPRELERCIEQSEAELSKISALRQHRERDQSPSHRERDQSPSHRERDQSPSHRGRDQSPSHRGRDQLHARRDQPPSHRGRDQSPSHRGRDQLHTRRDQLHTRRDQSPSHRRRDQPPSHRRRDQLHARRDQSPSHRGRDQSLSHAGRDQFHGGRDQQAAQDIYEDSQMDVSTDAVHGDSDDDAETTGETTGVLVMDLTPLIPGPLDETQGSCWEFQPEDQDEELEKTLSSHGTTLLDQYPGMLSQIGEAWRRHYVSESAGSVLRKYHRMRWSSRRNGLNNCSVNSTLGPAARNHAKTVRNDGRTVLQKAQRTSLNTGRPKGAEAGVLAPWKTAQDWQVARMSPRKGLESPMNQTFIIAESRLSSSHPREEPDVLIFSPAWSGVHAGSGRYRSPSAMSVPSRAQSSPSTVRCSPARQGPFIDRPLTWEGRCGSSDRSPRQGPSRYHHSHTMEPRSGYHHSHTAEPRSGYHHSNTMEPRSGYHHSNTVEPRSGYHHSNTMEPRSGYHHSNTVEPRSGYHHSHTAEPRSGYHHSPTVEPRSGYHHSNTMEPRSGYHHSNTMEPRSGYHHSNTMEPRSVLSRSVIASPSLSLQKPVMSPRKPVMSPREPVMSPREPVLSPREPVMSPRKAYQSPSQSKLHPSQSPALSSSKQFRSQLQKFSQRCLCQRSGALRAHSSSVLSALALSPYHSIKRKSLRELDQSPQYPRSKRSRTWSDVHSPGSLRQRTEMLRPKRRSSSLQSCYGAKDVLAWPWACVPRDRSSNPQDAQSGPQERQPSTAWREEYKRFLVRLQGTSPDRANWQSPSPISKRRLLYK